MGFGGEAAKPAATAAAPDRWCLANEWNNLEAPVRPIRIPLFRLVATALMMAALSGCCVPAGEKWEFKLEGSYYNLDGTREHGDSGRDVMTVFTTLSDGESVVTIRPLTFASEIVLFYRPPRDGGSEYTLQDVSDEKSPTAFLLRSPPNSVLEFEDTKRQVLSVGTEERKSVRGAYALVGDIKVHVADNTVQSIVVHLTTKEPVPKFEFRTTSQPATMELTEPATINGEFRGYWQGYCHIVPFI